MKSSIAPDVSPILAEDAAPRAPDDRPTGAARATVSIERDLCKGCGFCIEFCPAHALESDAGFNAKGYHPPRLSRPDACVGCNLCGLYCPDFAIFGHTSFQASTSDESDAPATAPSEESR